MKLKRGEPFITIEIVGDFADFNDFYDKNRGEILEAIIEIYNEFLISKTKTLRLLVSAEIYSEETIGITNWNTMFSFYKKDSDVLINDVLPYFEEVENYEKCAEIINLHELLTKKKKLSII